MSENPSALIIGALSADSGDTLAAEKGEQLVSRLASHLAARASSGESRELLRESLAAIRALREDAESIRQRYIGLFNAVPDAVTLHDLKGRILDANVAACRIYGYTREELQQRGLHDLNPELPPDHLEQVLREHRTGEIFSVESVNYRGDGTRFPVEVHSALFVDRGQRRILAVARDISRRLATETELRDSEERYRELLRVMDKGVMVQDAEGHVISVNAAACRILGMTELELLGPANYLRNWRFIREDGHALPYDQLPGMIAIREGRNVDSTLIGVYHQELRRYGWLSVLSVPQFMTGESKPFQVISMFSEVTEFKRDSELFRRTQALARIGGWDWDPMQQYMYWTDTLYDIVERRRGEPVDIEDFLSHVAATDRARVRTAMTQAQSRGDAFDLECRMVTEDGNQRWARIIGNGELREGERFRTSGTLQDITVNKLHEDELRRQALTDPLTQLPNRDAILERIGSLLEGGEYKQPALLYVDLDRFKVLNDLLGHRAADELLRAAARRLRECVAGDGIVGRYSGDEFLVLMPDGSGHRSEATAERINRAFTRSFQQNGEEFAITCSVGIARAPEDGDTTQRLIQSADSAMSDAKRRGRNTWQSFTSSLAQQLSDQLLMETHLRRALENEEFRLVYQPQVDLATGKLYAVEALIRWHNKTLGEMSPDRFINHAETTGDIVPIGAWVIREACRQLREWLDQGLEIERVAVNVSYRQFLSEELHHVVVDALGEFHLPPEALELEITERVLIEDVSDTVETFATLKELGVTLTIDDFGEGYSALNYLRRLPIDGVKISHSFLRGVPEQASDVAICQAIIGIAQSLGLELIAEGVESPIQREFLLAHGVTNAQGYLFSKPRPGEDIPAYQSPGPA